MTEWGRAMYVTPGVVVDGKLVTTDLVDINLGIRILLGSSYYDDWEDGETFVKHDPLGNPVDQRHPWNQTTHPQAAEARLRGQVHLGHVAALVRQADRGPPGARHRRRADRAALGDGAGRPGRHRLRQGDRPERQDLPAQDGDACPRSSSSGRSPSGATPSSATGRAPTSRPTRPRRRLYFVEQALEELHAGRTKTWTEFKVPDEAIGCGFHEAVRGVLSHHVVIRDGKIANYHPYPPTPWNANPRDIYGTPGPYEDAVQNTPIFEENGPDKFKGIDIMRTVRSFDPCLPCGVHMYLGDGKVLRGQALADVRRPASGVRASVNAHVNSSTRDNDIRGSIGRIETLIGELEQSADPAAQAQAREIVQAVLDFHGAALAKLLGHVAAAGEPGRAILEALGRRRPGLEPAPAPRAASRRPRGRGWDGPWTRCGPSSAGHGGDVELLGLDGGVVRLRMQGSCHGCPSSAVTLQATDRKGHLRRGARRRGHRGRGRRRCRRRRSRLTW